MEKRVQQKYRLYRRRKGKFYWQENDSKKQGTLRTRDRREAQTLLNAMNEAQRQPILNLSLARTYLAAHDPKMITRTWRHVTTEMATPGIAATQERCSRAFCSKGFDPIRGKPLVQRPPMICLESCMRMETASAIICDACTISPSILLAGVADPFEARIAENPKPGKESDHCRRTRGSHRVRKERRTQGVLESGLRATGAMRVGEHFSWQPD